VTVAVTLFAVLELYKQGELSWSQDEPFGDIVLVPAGARAREATLARSSMRGAA
jgi:segregation and condensation protein A